jgi:hypothetical protein
MRRSSTERSFEACLGAQPGGDSGHGVNSDAMKIHEICGQAYGMNRMAFDLMGDVSGGRIELSAYKSLAG